jgi:hypothetical protein
MTTPPLPSVEPPKREPWWESKLALLLIGAAISSVLVPWLQYFQKNLEWKRQQRYDRTNYRIQLMREAYREFALLGTMPGEAGERSRLCVGESPVSAPQYEDCRKQFVEVQNRRYAQAGKVIPLLSHFPEGSKLLELFHKYVRQSSEYMRRLEETLLLNGCAKGAARCEGRRNVAEALEEAAETEEGAFSELNVLYEVVLARIREQIEEVEKRNEDSIL